MVLLELPFRDAVLLDVACALAVHAFYRRYEPDTSVLFMQFILLVVVPGIPTASFIRHFHDHNLPPGLGVLVGFVIYYSSLVGSVVAYRLSPWHPLAKYPGPILAKVSRFWVSYRQARGKLHEDLKKLHDRYGLYVRIGPNEVSITDVSIVSSCLANGMPKGPMWKARIPPSDAPPLIAIRSTNDHNRRRKRWNRGLNISALKGYEPTVQKRALQFIGELEKRSVKNGVSPVNLAEWISFFATDLMGDMAFGGGFELMRDGGDKDDVWAIFESGLKIASIYQHLPWVTPLLFRLPFVKQKILRLRLFGMLMAGERKAKGAVTKDLFYHLIDEDNVDKDPPTDAEIVTDGTLVILAGSDTTSTTLSGLFYYLLSNPHDYRRLQKEIDSSFPLGEGDPFDTLKLSELPFLNAVINEAMRLQPPVPTYLQRAPEAGTGGKLIGDKFISEETSVVVPPYALHRRPAYFSPATETFWPDRWLPRDAIKRDPHSPTGLKSDKYEGEIITNQEAFIPFSYGPANCAGRSLALLEMRMITALLMQRFEMRFANGFDPREWEARLKDFFVMSNGPLPVTLTPRL